MTEVSLSFELTNSERRIAHAANKGFAIAGVLPMKNRDRLCFADTFVQGGSSVLRMKFSAINPRHRKPPNCYALSTAKKLRSTGYIYVVPPTERSSTFQYRNGSTMLRASLKSMVQATVLLSAKRIARS